MGAIYSVVFSGVSISAQQDLFEIAPASGKPCVLHSLYLSQQNRVGDASEAELTILIKRGATTTGSGGTAPTPQPANPSAAAAGATTKVNNTTRVTGGTINTLHVDNWNVRVPFVYLPPPELRHQVAGGSRMTVELATTPGSAITASGTAYFEEIG